ncbi:restriction endonuclease subunit S [Pseudoalteromonas sp. YIC-656]|uniref:restriction endonuclease subunit S n=1 Tax=Pseudoalteromonas pernae TaxID=3118054 RepID=UPI00324238E9
MASRVKLSELCSEISYGYTASADSEVVGPKFLRITDIQGGVVNWDEVPYCKVDEKNLAKNLLKKGDIVVARTGNSTGENYIFEADDDAVFASYLIRFRVNPELANPYFVWLQMRTHAWWNFVSGAKGGSAQAGANAKILGLFEVELPERNIQDKIVSIVFDYFNKIELNRQTNQTLEQMAQALFKSWFVDFDPVIDNALAAGNDIPEALQHKAEQRAIYKEKAQQLAVSPETKSKPLPDDIRALFPSEFEQTDDPSIGVAGWIPKGWSSIYLSDLLDVKYGKDHKKLDEGEYPVYGSGGLMRRVDKFLYEGESVLIPRKGTLSNIMYVNETFWSVDTMFFTIPKLPNVAKFTFYLLKRLNFDNMNVGSAVPSMTTKVLNALPVVCPSESVLAKFDEIMDLYFSKIQANQASTNQLEQLRDSLLPKLISGEITLSNKDVA